MDTADNNHQGQTTIEQPDSDQQAKPSSRRNSKPMAAASTADETKNGTGGGNSDKSAREPKIGLLPTATAEKEVTYKGKVVGEFTWATLPVKALFSVSEDGSHPYMKTSKSAYVDLVTEEPTTSVPPKTQQKLYRVKLQ